MVAMLFVIMGPIPKGTHPGWCPTTLLSFKSIVRTIFELKFGNQNVVAQMCKQPDILTGTNFKTNLTHVVSYHPVKFQTDQ